MSSAPLAAASAFGANIGRSPFRRGMRARGAGRPASESEPSATSSSSGMGEHAVERLLARCSRRSRGSRRSASRYAYYAHRMESMHHLVLEDGTVFPGIRSARRASPSGEACFTTAMTGYEEAVTDPSYVAQVLCFAYPLVGTYGVDEARMESERVQCEGVVMRDARPAFAAWLREQRRRRADGRRHAHARAADPRRRRRSAARSATRRSRSSTPARSPSRHRRPAARPAGRRDRAVLGRRRPAGRRRRPRLEALDPAPARRRRPRGLRRPRRRGTPTRSSRPTRRRC